jgi:ribosome biogenesis GTPase A
MLLRSAGQDIYVVGEANAGKSTLLNAFRAKASMSSDNDMKRFSTSSIVPGTTMDEIKYPLKEMDKIRDFMTRSRPKITAEKQKKALEDIKNKVKVKDLPDKNISLTKSLQGYLVDTPGIAAENNIAQYLTEEELRFALPSDKLKFTHIYFMPGKSIYFGGLGRIDFVEGKAQVICTVFHGPKIPIHINNTEKFDNFWLNNAGGRNIKWDEKLVLQKNSSKVIRKNYNKDLWSGVKLVPPFFTSPEKFAANPELDGLLHDRIEKYPEMKLALESIITREKPLDDHAHSSSHFRQSLVDFVISGFGWFSIAGNFCKESHKTATFQLWSPDGKGIFGRQPLLPFHSGLRGKKRKGLPFYSKYDPKLAAKLQSLENDYLKSLK